MKSPHPKLRSITAFLGDPLLATRSIDARDIGVLLNSLLLITCHLTLSPKLLKLQDQGLRMLKPLHYFSHFD